MKDKLRGVKLALVAINGALYENEEWWEDNKKSLHEEGSAVACATMRIFHTKEQMLEEARNLLEGVEAGCYGSYL